MSEDLTSRWSAVEINLPVWLFTGLAVVLAVSRFISRSCLSLPNTFGWEDYLIVASLGLCLACSSILSVAVGDGAKIIPADILGSSASALLMSFIANTTFLLSVPLPKIAVSMLLIRTFQPGRWMKYLLMGSSILLFLIAIAEYLLHWVSRPPAYRWNPGLNLGGVPWSTSLTTSVIYVFGLMSGIQDFALALYPAVQISKLRLAKKKKFSLSILFGLGAFAGSISITRTVQLVRLHRAQQNSVQLYDRCLETGLWNALENAVVIIAACTPMIFPLLHWARKKTITYWTNLSSSRQRSIDEVQIVARK